MFTQLYFCKTVVYTSIMCVVNQRPPPCDVSVVADSHFLVSVVTLLSFFRPFIHFDRCWREGLEKKGHLYHCSHWCFDKTSFLSCPKHWAHLKELGLHLSFDFCISLINTVLEFWWKIRSKLENMFILGKVVLFLLLMSRGALAQCLFKATSRLFSMPCVLHYILCVLFQLHPLWPVFFCFFLLMALHISFKP